MLSLNDKVADLPKSTLLDDGDNEAITASLTAQTFLTLAMETQNP